MTTAGVKAQTWKEDDVPEGWAVCSGCAWGQDYSNIGGRSDHIDLFLSGKKKSKFKDFKSFFGKKKKKEPEEVLEGTMLKSRFSSSSVSVSSLQPGLESQVESKPKSGLGAKSISHDSVFCSDLEPEKTEGKLYSSPEPQRSSSPKIQSLRSRRFGISPLIIKSDKVSQDSEKTDDDDRTPKNSRRRSLQHSPTSRKSVSEMSSDAKQSQSSESSTQHVSGFSTPATSQGCLDSSAAKHKIALNPQKQKKKLSSTSVKVKQEEQVYSVTFKEKTITKTKQAEQKESLDSTGLSSQEQSYKTETQDKTEDETQSIDAASGYCLGFNPRRCRRRFKNEWGIIQRGLLKSTQGYGLSTKVESSANEEIPGGEHSFLKLFLEKKSTGQSTTTEAEITSPQEMPSEKGDAEEELANIDVEAQRAPAPQCTSTDVAKSVSPLPCQEHGLPEGKKKKDKATVLQWIRKSTSQEEAQVHMHPSQVCGEEEEASSPSLQTFQPQMELSLESTTYHKEKNPQSGVRTLSTNVSSATAEDDASSVQMMPVCPRKYPNAEEISSDSKSTSEYESSSEVQLGPTHSLQTTWKPKDDADAGADGADGADGKEDEDNDEDDDEEDYEDEDDDVFLKSETVDVELSKMEQQQPLRYSSQSLGKPKAREASEQQSSSEGSKSCEEMTSAHSSQSLEEFEECSESRSFTRDSVSEEQPSPRRHSQALPELEEKEVSTESSSYVEKYHSSEDLSSSVEEQQEVSPVSKSSLKQWTAPTKLVRPIHTSPPIISSTTQQQPPIMVNISVGPNKSVEPLPPSHTVELWASSPSEHQVFAEPEGVTADWDIFMQPVSPRKALKGYHVEQNVPSSADIINMEEGASMETKLLRHHSQPPTRPRLEQEVSAGPELTVFEESIAAQPSRYPSQPSVRPSIKKEISFGVESAALQGSTLLESPPPQHHSQPVLKPFIQQQVAAFQRGISMDPKLPTQFQPWMKSPGKQSFSSTPESTAFEGSTSMEHMTQNLAQPMLQPYQEVSLESETAAAKMISMGQLHSKYSTHPLPSHQSQPVPESTSVEGAILVDLRPPQPSVTPKFQPVMTQDPVNTSTQWSSPMEPTSTKHVFQTQANPKFKQVPVGPDNPEAQGSMSMQPVPPRCPPQPWLTPTFEQISVPPGNVPSAWAIPIYSPAPRMPSQPLMGSVVKQPVSRGPTNPSVQQMIPVEPKPSRYSLQSWKSTPFEQGSVSQDHAAAASWNTPVDSPAPRMPSQPLMGSVVKQSTSTELLNVSVPQSSSLELLPSRFPFQPRGDPEHYVAEERGATLRRPRRQHSQPPVTSEFKKEVSPDSLRASGERSIPMEPMPPKYAPQLWLGSEFEQQVSSLEGVAKERDVLREAWLSGHPSQTIIKHKVEKTPSSFESTSTEGGVPRRPVPPKRPTSFAIKSKVQEMSSRLQSATAQHSSKKPQNVRAPSQSFVKFMAQQVFSDSGPSELSMYAKPIPRGRSRPSRSLLKSKLEEHLLFYNWDDEPKKDTTLKNLPTKQRLQLSRRQEEPQEVLPFSEGASVKWSTSAGDVSQSLGKLEYKQKASVSVSFPDECKRSEGQLPSTQPSQTFDVAELQPSILPADSANVPMEWRIREGHQPPGKPTQLFFITDYQQQVYVDSANAAAEGAIPEKNTGCWPMLKGPASTKNVKYGQGYGDLTKSTPTCVTKHVMFASAPAQKSFVPMDTYFKDEVPQCCDVSESSSLLSTSKADVKNVFGVRLRRISKNIGMENPDPCMPLAPVSSAASKEQANKEALQGSGRGPERCSPAFTFEKNQGNRPSPAFTFEENQGNRPRYEGTLKKSAVYRPPEKTSSWKADSSLEPPWITMVKQRQRALGSHFPKKSRSKSEIRAEPKEPRYEVKYEPQLEILPKESGPITDIAPKMTFLSIIPGHEMPQLRRFTKSVAFDYQKILHPYTRERETRRSSSLPPKLPEPKEPEWFSMAKKKAQAWSQMPDIMQ
ncbi:acrosomal protein KIAA1210 homolog [Grammomys surdaster]|uniref:acrosomal protein KIAA1210 homolog n=1 Tax=Grammomys surdaster TaxID=491861 RepID=UPI0010A0ACFE|nr:acrosomal protein KIAA1210 homolog [Grammomys surdaster]